MQSSSNTENETTKYSYTTMLEVRDMRQYWKDGYEVSDVYSVGHGVERDVNVDGRSTNGRCE